MTAPISSVLNGDRTELCDMAWAKYVDIAALNGSVIVPGYKKGMRKLKHVWEHGVPGTDEMQWGRMQHCLLYEPDQFEARFWPYAKRRDKRVLEYRELLEQAQAAGAEVVRATGQFSLESALEAARWFLEDERVQKLIEAGEGEKTVLAVELGCQCKGRLDWVSTSEHSLTDLKTSSEIDPVLFGSRFFRLGYDIKLGLYRHWLERVTNDRWPVEVIVLENKPPYDVYVMEPIPDAVLDRGVERGLGVIAKVRECIEKDWWPGISGGNPVPLYVPYREMEEETEEFQG